MGTGDGVDNEKKGKTEKGKEKEIAESKQTANKSAKQATGDVHLGEKPTKKRLSDESLANIDKSDRSKKGETTAKKGKLMSKEEEDEVKRQNSEFLAKFKQKTNKGISHLLI